MRLTSFHTGFNSIVTKDRHNGYKVKQAHPLDLNLLRNFDIKDNLLISSFLEISLLEDF